MKNFILLILTLIPVLVYSQFVTADPALEPIKITNTLSNANNASALPIGNGIKLKVPILNKNLNSKLPAGSCKIKIGLGSKLVLNPQLNLSIINTSNYFFWTAVSSGGQVQVIGDLINELPENYNDTANFDLTGIVLGSSTITINFLVTNHNTTTILSDENGQNNSAFSPYSIIGSVLPVNITNIFVENKNCLLKVNFETQNEINVNKYELELSNDFNQFEKIATLKASNLSSYSFVDFVIPEKYQVANLLTRVKVIDFNGAVSYSEIKLCKGKCAIKNSTVLYPNPIPKNSNCFYLQSGNGFFNGIYVITIIDVVGKIIETKEISLSNIGSFKYDITNAIEGKYFVKLVKKDSSDKNVFMILK